MKRKKGKERARRKKGGKGEIEMLAILVFVKAFLAGKKKLLDGKSPFGRNIFNNPARYIYLVNVLILIFTLDAVIATHMNIIFYSV